MNVTQDAYSRLSKKLADRPDHVAVRILLRDGRVKFRPSTPRPGDEVFCHEGRVVLVLSEHVAQHFGNRTLDVRPTHAGPRLRFRRRK